jgi:hypothetical protein
MRRTTGDVHGIVDDNRAEYLSGRRAAMNFPRASRRARCGT